MNGMSEMGDGRDKSDAALVRAGGLLEAALAHGKFLVECFDKDGRLKWRDTIENVVTTVGKNLALDTFLAGSGYTVIGPFMGLISSVSYGAGPVVGDSMGSHSGWTEAGATNAPTYTAPRKTCAWSAASAVDIPAAILTTLAVRVETASAADAVSASSVLAAALSEVATATEAPAALRVMAATASESAAAIDQQSVPGGAVLDATVAEQSSAGESLGAVLGTTANQLETAAALDSQAAAQGFAKVVAEPVDVTDALVAFLFGGAVLTEAAEAIEVFDAVIVGGTRGNMLVDESPEALLEDYVHTSGLAFEERVSGAVQASEIPVVIVEGG